MSFEMIFLEIKLTQGS